MIYNCIDLGISYVSTELSNVPYIMADSMQCLGNFGYKTMSAQVLIQGNTVIQLTHIGRNTVIVFALVILHFSIHEALVSI